MGLMKYSLVMFFISVSLQAQCDEWIIDPEKVMVHSTTEPLFLADEALSQNADRDVSSAKNDELASYSRSPDQYLDVVQTIPSSEPTLQRAWLEYKILKDNEGSVD